MEAVQTGLKSASQAIRKGLQNVQAQAEAVVRSGISSHRCIFNLNTPARFLLPYKAAYLQVFGLGWEHLWEADHSPREAATLPIHSFIHSLIPPPQDPPKG